MHEEFSEYFRSASFGTVEELAGALNYIAPYIGTWGLLEPISAADLRHFLPAWIRDSCYVNFRLPKKSGGYRKIRAPKSPLKEIQTTLNVLIQAIFTPSEFAYGFVEGRNVRGNAAIHAGQTCIYNIDLEDFFPSITKKMLRDAMRHEFSGRRISEEVIRIICAICTVPIKGGIEALPQGAPTSPVLSNIVLKRLDVQLAALAEKAGYRYSRYADDMTFSHSHSVRRIGPHWRERIESAIKSYGLSINEGKVHTFAPGERMEVTGLTVNCRPNVSRSYVKQLRTLLHLWEKYGYAQAQAIYTRDFEPGSTAQLKNVVNGKINYLEMIKGREDSTYRRLHCRYRRLLSMLD